MCCSVNGSVLLCVVFNICLVWLLFCCLMLWKCLVWVEVLCWIDHVWSSTECACCACDPSVHLSVHFICLFMCLYVSSLKSLRAGSQVFALLMLSLCVILHPMWSGKSLHLLCNLPFGMLCLSAISMMFVNIMLTVCMLV